MPRTPNILVERKKRIFVASRDISTGNRTIHKIRGAEPETSVRLRSGATSGVNSGRISSVRTVVKRQEPPSSIICRQPVVALKRITNIKLNQNKTSNSVNNSTNARQSSSPILRSQKKRSEILAQSIKKNKDATPQADNLRSNLKAGRKAVGNNSNANVIENKKYLQLPAKSPHPPTIAATRSRRAIKPNPKYTNDDIITPKYIGSLVNDQYVVYKNDIDTDDDYCADIYSEQSNEDSEEHAVFNEKQFKAESHTDSSDNNATETKTKRGRPRKAQVVLEKYSAENDSTFENSKFTSSDESNETSLPEKKEITHHVQQPMVKIPNYKQDKSSPSEQASSRLNLIQASARCIKRRRSGQYVIAPASSANSSAMPSSGGGTEQRSSNKMNTQVATSQANKKGSKSSTTHTFTLVNLKAILKEDEDEPESVEQAQSVKKVLQKSDNEITELKSTKPEKPIVRDNQEIQPVKKKVVGNAKPRILNSEFGWKTQAMKPLMNMVDNLSAFSTDNAVIPLSIGQTDLKINKNKRPAEIAASNRIKAAKPPTAIAQNQCKRITYNLGSLSSPDNDCNTDKSVRNKMIKRGTFAQDNMNDSNSKIDHSVRPIILQENWFTLRTPNKCKYRGEQRVSLPLISVAESIKEILLPSPLWSYKIGMPPNTTESEIYSNLKRERNNDQPVHIIFRREGEIIPNKKSFDRLLALKANVYLMKINGFQANFIESPTNLSSIEDIENLLDILDVTDQHHSEVITAPK